MGGRAVILRVALVVAAGLAGFVLAAEAQACVCANAPIGERLDDADAAVVGRVLSVRPGTLKGARVRLLTVEVVQRVKGDVPKQIVVRSPSRSDCDLAPPRNAEIGLLLTRDPDDVWLGSACSLVGAGELVVAGGEPRGGVIKVVVGVVILGLVLLWARRRLREGKRPELPGAPES